MITILFSISCVLHSLDATSDTESHDILVPIYHTPVPQPPTDTPLHTEETFSALHIEECPSDIPNDMACIPGGTMIRGTDEEHVCGQYENTHYKTEFGPSHTIWLPTYLIDKTEVTYEAYQQCVRENKCNYAHPTYSDFNRPKQPMMGVSWYDAQLFCRAHGKRLPSEAEWEKAARGEKGAKNPFDLDTITCAQAVIFDHSGRSCGVQKSGTSPHKGRVWEVQQKPAGRYDIYDMVGNAEEWVDDWFAPSLTACGNDCLGINPKGPCAGADTCPEFALKHKKALKIVKGGSWYWPAQDATGWHRRPHVPTNTPYHHFGFRCAQDIMPINTSTEAN